MKIGLVGESPHDTKSVENLLCKVYAEHHFVNLLHDIRGSQLDQMQPTKRMLRIEYQDHKPDLVIFIRDLDALASDRDQLKKRLDYFREFRTVVDNKAIYMLNIWELEALILCDLEAFMNHYNCECSNNIDPHLVESPKEFLKTLFKKYKEVDNADIFLKLTHAKLLETSSHYLRFIKRFETATSSN